jgi:hypothetical protein
VINTWQRFAAEGAPGLVSKPRGGSFSFRARRDDAMWTAQ